MAGETVAPIFLSAPHYVAAFETDGVVRRAAPILKYLVGQTDDQARACFKKKGWTASVVMDLSHGNPVARKSQMA